MGVNSDGRHVLLGLPVGDSENESFWRQFLDSLLKRSGASQVCGRWFPKPTSFSPRWLAGCSRAAGQRHRMHFARNLLLTVTRVQQRAA